MPPVNLDTLVRYCITVYDKLEENAVDTGEGLVWEGGLIKLFSRCGISNAHYSTVMNTLYEIGALVMLRRGARGVQTQIALRYRPTLEAVQSAAGVTPALTSPSAYDMLAQRVSDIEGRLDGIDLKQLIASFNERLVALERKAAKK